LGRKFWGGKVNNCDIVELIKQGESSLVEFKETFDKEAVETVAAFANTKGGSVLIGVSDKGKIKGLTIGKITLRDWANQILPKNIFVASA
jgi:ATP-dependent DNA helicase RecG